MKSAERTNNCTLIYDARAWMPGDGQALVSPGPRSNAFHGSLCQSLLVIFAKEVFRFIIAMFLGILEVGMVG